MKLRPILFSTAMVKSLLSGQKVQTRRTVKKQPNVPSEIMEDETGIVWRGKYQVKFKNVEESKMWTCLCRFGAVGDVLWVRETFSSEPEYYHLYRADCPIEWDAEDEKITLHESDIKWKPNIFMPKEACRIFLKITSIRVERANDISEEDSIKEGVLFYDDEQFGGGRQFKDYMEDASGYGHPDHDYPSVNTAKESFKTLWESINGKESWSSNPFVWVIDFERIEKPEEWGK